MDSNRPQQKNHLLLHRKPVTYTLKDCLSFLKVGQWGQTEVYKTSYFLQSRSDTVI